MTYNNVILVFTDGFEGSDPLVRSAFALALVEDFAFGIKCVANEQWVDHSHWFHAMNLKR